MRYTDSQLEAIRLVEMEVCDYMGVNKRVIYERSLKEIVCNTRYMIWYILHYDYGFTVGLLSKTYYLTKRNIQIGISKVKNGIKYQPYYRNIYDTLKERIK